MLLQLKTNDPEFFAKLVLLNKTRDKYILSIETMRWNIKSQINYIPISPLKNKLKPIR